MRIAAPLALIVAGGGLYPVFLVTSMASLTATTVVESAALEAARPLLAVLAVASTLLALVGLGAALCILGTWGPLAQEVSSTAVAAAFFLAPFVFALTETFSGLTALNVCLVLASFALAASAVHLSRAARTRRAQTG